MKKTFSIIVLSLAFVFTYAQDEPAEGGWINKVNILPTENCLDSITCYSEVIVEVNQAILMDSMKIVLTIGTNFGLQDIFQKTYIYTQSILLEESVNSEETGILKFNLGQFIVTENFFVEFNLE